MSGFLPWFLWSWIIWNQPCCLLLRCFTLLLGWGVPLLSSQINHTQRLMLNYECPDVVWLASCQLFLTYIFPSTFCLWAFNYIPFFLSYSVGGWVAGWLTPDIHHSLFSCTFLLVSPFILCLLAMSILASAWLLAVHLFIRTIRCFRHSNSASQLIKCSINKSNTPDNNIPQQFARPIGWPQSSDPSLGKDPGSVRT